MQIGKQNSTNFNINYNDRTQPKYIIRESRERTPWPCKGVEMQHTPPLLHTEQSCQHARRLCLQVLNSFSWGARLPQSTTWYFLLALLVRFLLLLGFRASGASISSTSNTLNLQVAKCIYFSDFTWSWIHLRGSSLAKPTPHSCGAQHHRLSQLFHDLGDLFIVTWLPRLSSPCVMSSMTIFLSSLARCSSQPLAWV